MVSASPRLNACILKPASVWSRTVISMCCGTSVSSRRRKSSVKGYIQLNLRHQSVPVGVNLVLIWRGWFKNIFKTTWALTVNRIGPFELGWLHPQCILACVSPKCSVWCFLFKNDWRNSPNRYRCTCAHRANLMQAVTRLRQKWPRTAPRKCCLFWHLWNVTPVCAVRFHSEISLGLFAGKLRSKKGLLWIIGHIFLKPFGF